jgi:hypothetical protein
MAADPVRDTASRIGLYNGSPLGVGGSRTGADDFGYLGDTPRDVDQVVSLRNMMKLRPAPISSAFCVASEYTRIISVLALRSINSIGFSRSSFPALSSKRTIHVIALGAE